MNKNIFRCEGKEREEVLETLHYYNQAINALYWLAGGCEDDRVRNGCFKGAAEAIRVLQEYFSEKNR